MEKQYTNEMTVMQIDQREEDKKLNGFAVYQPFFSKQKHLNSEGALYTNHLF